MFYPIAAISISWNEILVLGAIAGLVQFIWNAIAWMGLPHHHGDFESLADGDAMGTALHANKLKRAFYVLPHFKDYAKGMSDPGYTARLKEGPNAMLLGIPNGGCMSGSTFVFGLINNVVEGILLTLLIYFVATSAGLDSCLNTVLFSAGVGFMVSFAVFSALVNWMGFPKRYFWTSLLDYIVGYALMGGAIYGCGKWFFGA